MNSLYKLIIAFQVARMILCVMMIYVSAKNLMHTMDWVEHYVSVLIDIAFLIYFTYRLVPIAISSAKGEWINEKDLEQ